MNLKTLAVLLLAIAAVQGASTTIQCYDGAKLNGEIISKMKATTCGEGVTQCVKTVATGSGVSSYSYECSTKTVGDVGCQDFQTKDVLGNTFTIEVCVCTGNLCNAAPTK